MKNYLFLLRKPAHSGAYAQELFDVILTTAAFDQKLSLLWLDDAVFQLKQGQEFAAMLQSLTLYDVTQLYVEAESLQERGLTIEHLALAVQVLPRAEISHFIQQFTTTFN